MALPKKPPVSFRSYRAHLTVPGDAHRDSLSENAKRLWLGLLLPQLALEVFARGDMHERPFAVSMGAGTREHVLACNQAAHARGVRPNMRVSAAYALAGELRVHPRNETAEREALTSIAAWAGQFTSMASLAPPDGLVLEVGGSLALFGGLESLLARLRQGIEALGYTARLALAPTPLAATWLARAGTETPITDVHELRACLAPLPIAVLAFDAETQETLAELGLRCIGDCLRLPRDGLARRFGPALLRELDRALGKAPDTRAAYVAPPRFSGQLLLPAPVDDSEALLFAAQRLLRELAGFLRARAGGVQELCFVLRHAKGAPTRITLRLLEGSRNARYLCELLKARLERVVLRAPVEALRLHTGEVRSLVAQTQDLFYERDPASPEALAVSGQRLIEHLRARLGNGAVRGLCLVPEHRPEHSHRSCAAGKTGSLKVNRDRRPGFETRPLWLLVTPLPLQTVHGEPWLQGALRLCTGPERIESGWWDGQDVARDYFIAEGRTGSRLWVFRERRRRRRWFLHGIFS